MKRVLCSVLILGVLLSASLLSLRDMKCSVGEIAGEAETLRTSAGTLSREELAARSCSLARSWDRLSRRFMLYVPHDRLLGIAEHLAELPALAGEGDAAGFLGSLDAAIGMLHYLLDSVTPSVRTLL